MSEISSSCAPKLPRGVRLQDDKVRGGWCLLGPERVFQLDDVAVEILSRCDGVRTLEAIEADLAETFDVNVADMSDDVREFLVGMAEKGMVQL
ncbi:MAG: pyrroloquinoline quinone biosynthesis peptide chaperone PqqD [Rhodospirillaceae bacterium]|nr:pyrroloquinoline quinone biosynthesis peptide chaperone PqqD [Rhodospirillaceae bacterium]